MKKKIFCILLTFCMILMLLPVTAFAENTFFMANTESELREFINETSNFISIKLNNDITLENTLNITKTVLIDLNGYSLKLQDEKNGSVISVTNGGVFTLEDSSVKESGKITNGNAIEGGGVYVSETSTFTMNGGTITNCKARNGGGVYVYGDVPSKKYGLFKMTKGTISNCKTNEENEEHYGGGVCNFGNFIMEGGLITDCEVTRPKGCYDIHFAAGVFNRRNFTMTGGTISNNRLDGEKESLYSYTDYNDRGFYANGGTIDDKVTIDTNNTLISTSNEMTKFNGVVHNYGMINGGIFNNTVENHRGTIKGGIFYKGITGDGTIEDSAKATVTFETKGGSQIEEKKVLNGSKISKPANPTKSDYSFEGWYKDENYSEKWDFDNSFIIKDTIIYARWRDEVNPTINGLEDNKIYCEKQSFTVFDNDAIKEVTVNGAVIYPDTNGKYTINPSEEMQTVIVSDNDNNKATVTVKVNNGHSYEFKDNNSQYWQKCKYCNDETSKKDIPTIIIYAPPKLCPNSDYIFTFKIPENCNYISVSYGDNWSGSSLDTVEKNENGLYTVIVPASSVKNMISFKVSVIAKTQDGFTLQKTSEEIVVNSHLLLEKVTAKSATEEAEGNIEYWYCVGCDRYYKDPEGIEEISSEDVIIKKLEKKEIIKKAPVKNCKFCRY